MKQSLTVLFASVLLGAAAWAGPAPDPQYNDEVAAGVSQPGPSMISPVVMPHPWTLSLQGGVNAYEGSLNNFLAPGATYGVSLQYEPWRFLGFEAAYNGSANVLRIDPNGTIIRNGAYFALTPGYSIPLSSRDEVDLKPYVLGGIGWDSYTLEVLRRPTGMQHRLLAQCLSEAACDCDWPGSAWMHDGIGTPPSAAIHPTS